MERRVFLGFNVSPFLTDGLTYEELQEHEPKIDTWFDTLRQKDIPPATYGEIRGGLGALANAHPDSELWDVLRGVAAGMLYTDGRVVPSFDLISDISSTDVLAETLIETVVQKNTDQKTATAMLRAFLGRYDIEDNPVEARATHQAVINRLISNHPFHPATEILEADIQSKQPHYDPISAWADEAGIGEANIRELLAEESLWEQIPSPLRRYLYEQHTIEHQILSEEVSSEFLLYIAEKCQRGQEAYPHAGVWDYFRYSHATSLINRDYPDFAMDIARGVHDDFVKYHLVTLLHTKYKDEALELTATIRHSELKETILADALEQPEPKKVPPELPASIIRATGLALSSEATRPPSP